MTRRHSWLVIGFHRVFAFVFICEAGMLTVQVGWLIIEAKEIP